MKTIVGFKGKNILIFGLGIQGGGVGVAEFFLKAKANVRITDLKNKNELQQSLKKLAGYKIKYTLGSHQQEDFLWANLVIRNPDVPITSPWLKFCFDHHIQVEMDESLFMKLAKGKIIGVTGTRGKSTVTTLIGEILKKAGYQVLLGGNLRGIATLSLVDKTSDQTITVLELSSWQLQSFGWYKISPAIAVITNLYPDHLNRYHNFDEYLNDKVNIFKYQKKNDFLIVNQENKLLTKLVRQAKSRVINFSKKSLPQQLINNWRLRGEHNLENLAAAYEITKLFKINDGVTSEAIRKFKTLPFREEVIRVLDNVTYVNDSASTMPQATIAALKTFPIDKIILIAGGNSKKLPNEELIKEIVKVKKIILLKGTQTDEIEEKIKSDENLSEKKLIIGKYDNLKSALLAAKNSAKPGDIILFSPAATSFSMFKNEFDRGEQFTNLVCQL